ncbi:MAG: NDP-hexose 2,3-dehydratase family protein [Candidatus Omnitrophota bacterium]|nr:NDP-hexose 2,3-dehydratase family protein [Candidatus Omnitrophota bacterium]
MNTLKPHEIDFLKSALVKESQVNSVDFILDWLREKNDQVRTVVEQVPLDKLDKWNFDPGTGNITHQSGRFFSIEGIVVETNWGKVPSWEQPIINQPEIGYLGILTKKIGGILHFLMQAKIEPGNINVVQLAPTLQVTASNYTRVHKGKVPLYIEYFNGEKKVDILIDQLQSEQGARFLRKRNRNIIIEVPESENLPEYDNFIWLNLGQLKKLISYDNIVNMDTRTVVSGIQYGRVKDNLSNPLLKGSSSLSDFDDIISWITKLKSKYKLNVKSIPLKNVANWEYDGKAYNHREGKYFSVIGVRVEIDNREVVSWNQPMIKSAQEGLIAFIVKKINGVYHFLTQAKLEAGNFDILELAPTVQCLTGNYRSGYNEYSVPFINEVLSASKEQIWYSAFQSEEGGRFYKEQNLNMIVEAKDDFPIEVHENYCWLTFDQLLTFMKFNNYLNIEARSLLSAVTV